MGMSYPLLAYDITMAASRLEESTTGTRDGSYTWYLDRFNPELWSLSSGNPNHYHPDNGRWKDRVCHLIWEKSGKGDKGDSYGENALWGRIDIPKTIIIEALRACAAEVPVLVHTWEVNSFIENRSDSQIYISCLVKLFQSRTEVTCQLFLNGSQFVKKEYPIPLGGSDPDTLVRSLKQYELDIGNSRQDDRGITKISERLHFFPQPRMPIRSLLDTSQDSGRILDSNTFTVTIADTGEVDTENPSTWGGHAVLLYEGVKRGRYFMHMAHLTKGRGVDLFDSDNFPIPSAKGRNNAQALLEGVKGKSPTMYVDAAKITHLIKDIIVDIQNKKTEFLITGGDSVVSGVAYTWEFIKLVASGKSNDKRFHNCVTWILEKLKAIGVEYPSDPNAWLMAIPKNYVGRTFTTLKSQIANSSCNPAISADAIKSSLN